MTSDSSCTSATRPSGIVLANSWAIAIIGSMAGVRVGPGATALTRMFCGPYSAAHALVSSSIAAARGAVGNQAWLAVARDHR